MRFIFLIFLLTSGSLAKLEAYSRQGDGKYFWGCDAALEASASFCEPGNYTCNCVNKNFQASIAGCLDQMGETSKKAKQGLADYCEEYAEIPLEGDWFDAALKDYKENGKTASEIPAFNMTVPIDVPFILDKSITQQYKEGYDKFYNNYDNAIYYGAACLGYWLIVLLISAICNLTKFLFPEFIKNSTVPIVNYYRKYISIPALVHKKKSQEQTFFNVFSFLIPSRLETLIIFLFYCVTIMVMSINMEVMTNDPLYYTKYMTRMRYVADRAGIVATIEMPLIFLFAGRNNFLQWLTGFNYATFVGFHRHTARVMFALIVIHAVCFTIVFGDYYSESIHDTYLRWGIIAGVAGGIIMVQGMLYLRRKWYELFLFMHIILAAIWTAGAWIHVRDLGFIWLVYPTIAVWLFDRLIRIGRLISFGFPHASVALLSDETLKVVIPKPNYWHSIPGGHAFIHFLKPSYFWQSHPFTFTDSYEDKNEITLFCKVKGGVTHSLYKMLANSPDRIAKVRVSVEGPYGEPTPAKHADSAIFIAGGNGIPGIYSEVVDIAMRTKDKDNRVKLYWVIREYCSLYWFYEELLKLRNLKIETTIFVTKPDSNKYINEFSSRFSGFEKSSITDDTSKDESEEKDKTNSLHEKGKDGIIYSNHEDKLGSNDIIDNIKAELSHIDFKEGRPDLHELMAQEVVECKKSVAFVTCGHGAMVDNIRYECAQLVTNEGRKRVDFYEQLQTWC